MVFLLAACGGSDSNSQGSFRVAAVDLKSDLSIAETVRLAMEHKLGIREIVAVQRRGGDELTGTYVPDPDASPDEAEQQFIDEDLSELADALRLAIEPEEPAQSTGPLPYLDAETLAGRPK